VRGGIKGGGGATLTETGYQALALYQGMSIKVPEHHSLDSGTFMPLFPA
jgi:molybdenum-dependent DNA-binding transcriptional regulator ModE